MIDTMEEEELSVLAATRSPHGYLTSPITDNIHRKEDGSLVIVGVPIARTGWQKYTVGDLPKARAEDLGVDVSNPAATIDLYRPASEVFDKEFLSSLNGATITDGHPPEGEFVNKDNFRKYSMGHIQNPRKGPDPLEDGEWPIIADLIISGEPLVSKVLNKTAREISLGYDFSIDRDGDKIIQCDMLGNHNAVVPKGRAGDFVRIEDAAPESIGVASREVDAAPEEVLQTETKPVPVAEVIEAISYPPIKFTFTTNKEKQPVSATAKLLRLLGGKHLIEMARATDADPEKIMEAAEAFNAPSTASAKDGEVPPELKENQFKKEESKADDTKAKDTNEDGGAMDRKAAHDALDKALDRKRGKDSNIPALKSLLDNFLTEEEQEEEHVDEPPVVDSADLEKVLAGDAEMCPDCDEPLEDCTCEAADDAVTPGEEEVESGEAAMDEKEGESPDDGDDHDDDQKDVEDRKRAKDSKGARVHARDGALATLRALRPIVARTNDKAMRTAFNTLLSSATRSSKASTGDYSKFASSARARDKAPRNPNPDRVRAGDGVGRPDQISAMQKFYDTAHKGGK
jgi:hypothetical protein